MNNTLLLLTLLQILIFHIDEYYFHRRRRLCRKEVISMFIDGALYLPPLVIAIFAPFESPWKGLYIFISVLSCLSIIKNEWFFNALVCKKERLAHAFLYVLHPVILYSFYISWSQNYFVHNLKFWMFQVFYLGFGVKTLTHQIIYWNYLRTDCDS